MALPRNENALEKARFLRKNMTPEERHLWYDFLRYYPMKFVKQRPIGSYIVDFFCKSANLVVEIDGSQHYEDTGLSYDAERTKYLESLGLMVIRYSNADITRRFQSVCESLDRLIRERSKAPPGGGAGTSAHTGD